MEIKQINTDKKGYFKALENNQEAGRMTYNWAGNTKFIVDHTEVNPDYKGQGVGKLLFEKMVDFARQENYKVIPLCPFAKAMFDKMPEAKDVRA